MPPNGSVERTISCSEKACSENGQKRERYKNSPAGIVDKERKRLKYVEKLAAGVVFEHLVIPSSDKEEKRAYDVAKYTDGGAAKLTVKYVVNAPTIVTKYASDAPVIAAKYAADASVIESAYRTVELASGVSVEELGPEYEEIRKEIESRFQW